jgi:twinkle protein
MGKSQMVRELEHYLLNATDENIGILALEESVKNTTLGVMSIEANKPLHLNMQDVDDSELKGYWDKTMGKGSCVYV